MSAAKKKLDTNQVASELSESAYFQSTSTQTDKTTKPQVDKYTTHLLPETIEAVKSYAFFHKMKDYEVVQLALDQFLSESETSTVTPTPVVQPVPDDLTSLRDNQQIVDYDHSLREFADLHAVARNEAERLWKTGMIAGSKQGTGSQAMVMLGTKGRHDFWIQFHEMDGFRSCDLCPHEMLHVAR